MKPGVQMEEWQRSTHLTRVVRGHLGSGIFAETHSEGDQPWDFFGRNDAEAEAPVLWPPHAKS